jgi:hypothetical protein
MAILTMCGHRQLPVHVRVPCNAAGPPACELPFDGLEDLSGLRRMKLPLQKAECHANDIAMM